MVNYKSICNMIYVIYVNIYQPLVEGPAEILQTLTYPTWQYFSEDGDVVRTIKLQTFSTKYIDLPLLLSPIIVQLL